MPEENADTIHQDEDFIDESGWTSMEPEGAGHHPHVWSDFPDVASEERWDDDFGGEPGGGDSIGRGDAGEGNPFGREGVSRGRTPVEGDGWGAPE